MADEKTEQPTEETPEQKPDNTAEYAKQIEELKKQIEHEKAEAKSAFEKRDKSKAEKAEIEKQKQELEKQLAEVVQAKTDAEAKAAETKGPYTCEWFKENYGARCEGCTQKVSTPLLLGKIVEAAPITDDTYIIEKPEDAETPAITLNIPAYPFPYFRGATGGVYRKESDADGNPIEKEIPIIKQFF